MPSPIYTLPPTGDYGEPAEPLRTQIERGLRGTHLPTVPGTTDEDKQWAYRRSVPTVVLYDEQGLRLYDGITSHAKEYYLFEDELNLLKDHGPEIAEAMGFPTGSYPPAKEWKPARWGDTEVGRYNNGVNGEEGLAAGISRGWDIVELGAGALRKTAHLLTALADALPDQPGETPITYHALDLSLPELDRVLGQMEEGYGAALGGRVSLVGLHGDYNAGIKAVRSGTLSQLSSGPGTPSMSADPGSPASAHLVTPAIEAADLPAIANEDELSLTCDDNPKDKDSKGASPTSPASPAARPLHFLFLGSSLGNFARADAAAFLKQLPMRPGDTLLLGLDGRPPPGRAGRHKVEQAYNDPAGYTRAFEEHGWDVARAHLGLAPDAGVEFVGRYNEALGRHEAYYRAKRGQTIALSDGEVEIAAGELLHIEWSFKYSLAEALALFDTADLTVVESWKAPGSEYRLWLLERPPVRFSEPGPSVPSLAEWHELWAAWDHITAMIPRELLHQKPIDLRHIPLFYLGHIPTFLDIYLTHNGGTPTPPAYFRDMFERGIDPDVDDPTKVHAHSAVPTREADWPNLGEINAFRDAVRARLRARYAAAEIPRTEAGYSAAEFTRTEARALVMAYEHEAMHAETLLYMLLQSPLTRPPTRTPAWCLEQWTGQVGGAGFGEIKHSTPSILDVPATRVVLGHDDAEAHDAELGAVGDHEFGWDIEHPATAVDVAPFRAHALPVTNGEYHAWFTREASGTASGKGEAGVIARAPASWIRHEGDWAVRTLYGPVPMAVAAAWPLTASRDELAAFARSRGGRLPTEPELRALWAHPLGPKQAPNAAFRHWHPVPPAPSVRVPAHGEAGEDGRAHSVVHGHNGGVWEWTDTLLTGLPGYMAGKLYPGYSADFFDGKHYVVLGASFATVPRIARRSFRNWYQGNYRYAWAGARVVYDV